MDTFESIAIMILSLGRILCRLQITDELVYTCDEVHNGCYWVMGQWSE